jgi:prevent-host-death family protein
MTRIAVGKVKAQFPELLERVAAGESIAITRDGAAVACLVPPSMGHRAGTDPEKLITQWKKRRKTITLGKSVSVRSLINEGRL